MSIGNRMRGLGESVYYLDNLKPKMDELMGDVSYELNHEVGKRKLLVRLDGFGEEYKPQIETLMDEELPLGYRMEYDPFPLDFIRLDFLESTGTQRIDLLKLNEPYDTETIGFYGESTFTKMENAHAYPISIWGFNGGKGTWFLRGVGKSRDYDDSISGQYFLKAAYLGIIPIGNRVIGGINFLGDKFHWAKGGGKEFKLNLKNFDTVSVTSGAYSYTMAGSPYTLHHRIKISQGNVITRDFIPALDKKGKPCFYDTIKRIPFYNTEKGQFIAGLTMKQALNLAKLPTPSDNNSLTISLPKEATLVQHNQKVNAALETAAEKGWNIPVQYRAAGEEKEIINKYVECKTVDDVIAVNADYKNDLTEDGEWIYPLPEMTVFPSPNMSNGFFTGSKLKKIKGVFPKCTESCALAGQVSTVEEVDVEFPIATYVTNTCLWRTNLKKLRIVAPKARYFYGNAHTDAAKFVDCEFYAPVTENIQELCSGARYLEEVKGEFGANVKVAGRAFYNCEKLRVLPTSYPMMQVAPDMFYGCQLSAETAIAILNSFPKWTSGEHLVTVGIHVDYENDEGVIAAIENTEAKGWAVTTQWNGTATAQVSSTYGLRKKPIYAKLGIMELGDGTIEQYLAWGHYVTNWEKNGYQEFASIEEAEEHFNIKKEITE